MEAPPEPSSEAPGFAVPETTTIHLSKWTAGILATIISAVVLAALGSGFAAIMTVNALKKTVEDNRAKMSTHITVQEFERHMEGGNQQYTEIIRRLERIEDRVNR